MSGAGQVVPPEAILGGITGHSLAHFSLVVEPRVCWLQPQRLVRGMVSHTASLCLSLQRLAGITFVYWGIYSEYSVISATMVSKHPRHCYKSS